MDNKALADSINNPKDKPIVQLRKLIFIAEHIDEMVHIPGKRNFAADYLSRLLEDDYPNRFDCNSMKLEPPINYHKLFAEQLTDPIISELEPSENFKRKNLNYQGINYSVWFYENLRVKDLIYVPESMVDEITGQSHNLVHPGQKATIRFIANRFYWPDLKMNVKNFVRNCARCQLAKKSKNQIVPISRIGTPLNRFEHLHLDLVGPLPITEDGYLHMLTIIDRYSRFVQVIPIRSKTAEETWSAFQRGWIQIFGLPKAITMDRGSNFKSKYFGDTARKLGIHVIHTTARHPQSNGLLENYHHKLKNSLRALADPDWATRIPMIVLIWNNVIREDGLYSPSQIVFGTNLMLPGQFFDDEAMNTSMRAPNAELIRAFMKEIHGLRATDTNQHRNRYPGVIARDLHSSKFVFEEEYNRKGLQPNYRGPYEVISRDESFFTLDKPSGPSTVSIANLKPAYGFE